MRHAIATAALFAVACGSNCPPVEESAARARTENTPVARASRSARSLDGRWVVGEPGESAELILEIQGDAGRLHVTRGGRMEIIPLRRTHPGAPARFEVVGDPSEAFFIVGRGPNRAVLFEPGDDDLMTAFRMGDLRTEARGEWVIVRPGSSSEDHRIVIGAEFAELHERGETHRVPVYGLTSEGSTINLALGDPEREGEFFVLRMLPVGDGSYVVWQRGDDDYGVAHRPGARPAWADQGAPMDSPPPPTDNER